MPSSQSYYNEVQSIFIELFDRPAGVAGYDYFGSELASGANPVTVFDQIAGSPEVSSSLTVTDLFENLLGRAPAAAGLTFFNGELSSGMTIAQVASQIYFDVLSEPTNSQDYMVMTDKIDYANNYTGYAAANPGFTYDTANASAYINQVTPAGVMTGVIPTPPTPSSMPSVNSFVSGTTVDIVSSQSSYMEPSSMGIINFVANINSGTPHITVAALASDTLQAGAGGATLTINANGASVGDAYNNSGTDFIPASMSGVTSIVINNDYRYDTINVSGIAGVNSLTINQLNSHVVMMSFNDLAIMSTSGYASGQYIVSPSQIVTLENIRSGSSPSINSTGTSANVHLVNVGTSSSSPWVGVNVNDSVSGTTGDRSMSTLNLTFQGDNNLAVYLYDDASTLTLSALNITDTNANDSVIIAAYSGASGGNIDSVNASKDAATLTYIMPSSLSNSSGHFTFIGGTGTDTVQLTAAPQVQTSSLAAFTYSFDGNASGTNTLDVNYNATQTDLNTYTYDAANFNTLAFSASDTNIINLAQINPAFDNINFGTSAFGSSSAHGDYSFTNAAANDVFTVSDYMGPTTPILTIADASGVNTTHLVMDATASSQATLGILNTNAAAVDITMNAGSSYWTQIGSLGMSGGLGYQSTVNIISNSGNGTFHGYNNSFNAINMSDGGTVTASGSGSLQVGYNTSSYPGLVDQYGSTPLAKALGVTFNASGLSGDLCLYDGNSTPDHITFGSGATTAYIVGDGNYTVNFGSGADTAYVGTPSSTATGSSTVILGSGVDWVRFDLYGYSGAVKDYTQTLTLGTGTAHISDHAIASTGTVSASGTYSMYDYINITNGASITASDKIGFYAPGGTPTDTSATVMNENALITSSITNAADAISTVIHALQTADAGANYDTAAWFQYGGSTYIVNDYNAWTGSANSYTDQVVQLTGTVAIPTTSLLSGALGTGQGTTVSHL